MASYLCHKAKERMPQSCLGYAFGMKEDTQKCRSCLLNVRADPVGGSASLQLHRLGSFPGWRRLGPRKGPGCLPGQQSADLKVPPPPRAWGQGCGSSAPDPWSHLPSHTQGLSAGVGSCRVHPALLPTQTRARVLLHSSPLFCPPGKGTLNVGTGITAQSPGL